MWRTIYVSERLAVSLSAHAAAESHYLRSSYRESIVEHLFIGSLLRHFWRKEIFDVEVLKPQVDDAGYDLVLESNGVIRHVQLKAKVEGSTTSVPVNIRLADEKRSGCVVAVVHDPTFDPGSFRYGWFGSPPGLPLPEAWKSLAVARHTKGNASGVKTERPNIRKLPYSKFLERGLTLDELADRLFGKR
jgi:hypothetical protein